MSGRPAKTPTGRPRAGAVTKSITRDHFPETAPPVENAPLNDWLKGVFRQPANEDGPGGDHISSRPTPHEVGAYFPSHAKPVPPRVIAKVKGRAKKQTKLSPFLRKLFEEDPADPRPMVEHKDYGAEWQDLGSKKYPCILGE